MLADVVSNIWLLNDWLSNRWSDCSIHDFPSASNRVSARSVEPPPVQYVGGHSYPKVPGAVAARQASAFPTPSA